MLLRFFVLYYPFLIADGRVYKAVPPLYSIPDGKKRKYFIDNLDMINHIQKLFLSNNSVIINNKQLANKDMSIFFLTNADYIYHLEKVADTFSINPNLLELVLYHYIINNKSINFKELKKSVSKAYRFMDVYNENGSISVKGTIEDSNFIPICDKFFKECRDIIHIMEKNTSLYYTFNGKPNSTIYDIMKVYDKTLPNNLQRYKGLGEMPAEQLGESTVLPENRTLIRYTIEDIKETINTIREYESDTKKILSLVNNVTRDDLVE